ncbi:hypothetical protein BH23CHL2_BH23CHL2_22890 [soil metagenome]
MKILKNRANLLDKWQFTEGRRARAIWIDGPNASRNHVDRTLLLRAQPMNRRLI